MVDIVEGFKRVNYYIGRALSEHKTKAKISISDVCDEDKKEIIEHLEKSFNVSIIDDIIEVSWN